MTWDPVDSDVSSVERMVRAGRELGYVCFFVSESSYSFSAKTEQLAFSVFYLRMLGIFLKELLISMHVALWSEVSSSSWYHCAAAATWGEAMAKSRAEPYVEAGTSGSLSIMAVELASCSRRCWPALV